LSSRLPMRDILVLTKVGLVVMGEDDVTERGDKGMKPFLPNGPWLSAPRIACWCRAR